MEAQMQSSTAAMPQPAAGVQWRPIIYLLLPVIIIAALPLLPVNNYIIAATVRALIFITLGQAWNIVAGIGGLLSLGHGVFLASAAIPPAFCSTITASRPGSGCGPAR